MRPKASLEKLGHVRSKTSRSDYVGERAGRMFIAWKELEDGWLLDRTRTSKKPPSFFG
jgi:hypothetical protein